MKCALTGLALLLLAGGVPLAQERFPAQSIEIVVPFGAGGGADAMAQKLAQMLEPYLGVPLFVSHVPGASGNVGLTKLLINPPDGYTIAALMSFTVSAWASGVGYARPDDFIVLSIPQQSPSMLFVPADSAFSTFGELLDYAKTNPGRIRIATAGYGASVDITLQYFNALGYKMVNVPYAKPEQRYLSPFGKRTHAIYEQPGDVANLLASKRLRPLVAFDSSRHPAFPDVPSSKELGFAMTDLPNLRTLVVRAGTPPERVRTLVNAIDKALDTPEWKKFCAQTYTCTRKYTPQEAAQRVRDFFATSQRNLAQSGAARP